MLYKRLDRFVERLCIAVAFAGGLGLVFAVIITGLSVLMKLARRLLDGTLADAVGGEAWAGLGPILGEEELVRYAVGFALYAALPLVTYRRAHMRIDLLERAFGEGFNRVVDLIGDLVFAAIAWLILTRQWFQIFRRPRGDEPTLGELLLSGDLQAALAQLRAADESQILGLKLWPLYSVAELLTFVFFAVALFCVARSIRALFLTDRATG